jgi:hypothetical protein
MRIKRPYWLLLGMLLWLSGCGSTPMSPPDSQRPPGQIPTPQDAPAEPTFKPDVPPQVPHASRVTTGLCHHWPGGQRCQAGAWRRTTSAGSANVGA